MCSQNYLECAMWFCVWQSLQICYTSAMIHNDRWYTSATNTQKYGTRADRIIYYMSSCKCWSCSPDNSCGVHNSLVNPKASTTLSFVAFLSGTAILILLRLHFACQPNPFGVGLQPYQSLQPKSNRVDIQCVGLQKDITDLAKLS